jgi:photoactive yellow protein
MSVTALNKSILKNAASMAETSELASSGLLRRLPTMPRHEIDGLPFGVVKVDDNGKVHIYNTYESELGGIAPSDAQNKNFFTQIAPCTNNSLFFGTFKRGVMENNMNYMFPYTFTYKMKPTPVQVHLYRDETTRSNWILVRKV